MDIARYWKWSKRKDEKINARLVPICKDIERVLLRFYRGNPEMTAEVLNARAERERVWGK